MATSFSGGRSRNPWREPPTMGKQLVSFITCGTSLLTKEDLQMINGGYLYISDVKNIGLL
jgi:hypothetical protein